MVTCLQVELYGPELGHCLLGRDQQQQCQEVTALTSGRLLNTFINNMHTAAAAAAHDSQRDHADSTSSSSTPAAAAARRLLAADAAAANRAQPSPSEGSTTTSSSGGGTARQVHGPKLMLYAAHDTTILPLLSALGQHQTAWPGFTSHLAFELWAHRGQHFVRVLSDGVPLELPLRAGDTGAAGSGGEGRASILLGASIPLLHPIRRAAGFAGGIADSLAGFGREVLDAAGKWCAAFAGRAADASSSRLRSTGQGAGTASAAYVVSLRDFAERVVEDYVLSPKEYASACAAGGAAKQGATTRQQWLAQFY